MEACGRAFRFWKKKRKTPRGPIMSDTPERKRICTTRSEWELHRWLRARRWGRGGRRPTRVSHGEKALVEEEHDTEEEEENTAAGQAEPDF